MGIYSTLTWELEISYGNISSGTPNALPTLPLHPHSRSPRSRCTPTAVPDAPAALPEPLPTLPLHSRGTPEASQCTQLYENQLDFMWKLTTFHVK